MPLDLDALGPQIARLGEAARSQQPRDEARLARALEALREHAGEYAELAELAERDERRPSRPAVPLGPLDARYPLPTAPPAYTVLASDGSQIEPDRHGPVLCHLINVGSALLQYGPEPRAALESQPLLRFEEHDVYLTVGNQGQVLVQDRLLALLRHIAETRRLVDLAAGVGVGAPAIALQDGTLLLSAWGQGGQTYVWEGLLEEFLECLAALRGRGVPIASYISRPRGADVVSLLQLTIRPSEGSEGDSGGRGSQATLTRDDLVHLPDRAIFEALLAPGERSGVFRSSWSTSEEHYREHEIHFFYVNVGSEVARVEVPGWAVVRGTLDLIHGVVWDQCERGQGYPRALIEAHEKAVVTAADRRAYEALIGQALIASGLRSTPSEKERSKRVRSL